MPQLEAVVANLWPLEIANALRVGERSGRTTPTNTSRFLDILGDFPITVDARTSAKAWAETLNLARAHTVSAYHAAYLELAVRLGVPLATLDGK